MSPAYPGYFRELSLPHSSRLSKHLPSCKISVTTPWEGKRSCRPQGHWIASSLSSPARLATCLFPSLSTPGSLTGFLWSCPSFWKLSVSSALPMLRVCPIPLECSLPIFILSLPVRRPLPFLPLRSPSAALQSLLYSQLLSWTPGRASFCLVALISSVTGTLAQGWCVRATQLLSCLPSFHLCCPPPFLKPVSNPQSSLTGPSPLLPHVLSCWVQPHPLPQHPSHLSPVIQALHTSQTGLLQEHPSLLSPLLPIRVPPNNISYIQPPGQ